MSSYPFLVHSQESLSQQTAPNVDNQRLVRQKRRRTSPEDHAILEAEYDQNPKPDKATRIEIVKKVSLGEKEVQIWFQNRRQMTRRRSRPLLPHEILANLRTTSQSSERVPSSSGSWDESRQQWLPSSQSSMLASQSQPPIADIESSRSSSQLASAREQRIPCEADNSDLGMTKDPLSVSASETHDTESRTTNKNADFRGPDRGGGLVKSLSQAIPKKRRPECFGGRRTDSFIIHDEESQTSQQSTNDCSKKDIEPVPLRRNPAECSQSLRRTSSLVRLSMSLEGKAQVTTSTGTTPSPPRPQPLLYSDTVRRPNPGLQRSLSTVETSKKNSMANSSSRRPATGRSRDARTWEFYCDKDAREALTEQAEREESGSATAVIALIKSKSNTSKAASTKSNKRNGHNHKLEAAKRLKATEGTRQRLKLHRSQSSLADMQSVSRNVDSKTEGSWETYRKSGSKSALFERNEGDSDKENWVPGTQQRSPPRPRPTGSSQWQRRILEESLRHSSSLGPLVNQEREFSRNFSALNPVSSSTSSSLGERENGGSEVDGSVSFDDGKASPREADDLDCVQNLLSLSQAAWQ